MYDVTLNPPPYRKWFILNCTRGNVLLVLGHDLLLVGELFALVFLKDFLSIPCEFHPFLFGLPQSINQLTNIYIFFAEITRPNDLQSGLFGILLP